MKKYPFTFDSRVLPHTFLLFILLLLILAYGCSEKKKTIKEDFGTTTEVITDPLHAERIIKGEYLVNHVAVCISCHSNRDWNKLNAPAIPGTLGQGGQAFGPELHLPGIFYARNITPYGINRLTDDQLFKLLTTGENKEGEILYPWMPYPRYSQMDEEDLRSMIAYLRTLVPISNDVPKRKPNSSLTLKAIPASLTKKPSTTDLIAYGKYLVNIANCIDCHSNVNKKGEKLADMQYAGGFEFPLPTGGVVRSANITPDVDTGIGSWSQESFISRFKTYEQPELKNVTVLSGEFNTYMPWSYLSGMTRQDLGAMYEYLKTLKPIHNQVVKFTPPMKK